MKIKILCMVGGLFLTFNAFSAGRFVASLKAADKAYAKRDVASLLIRHYTATDIVRNELIKRHLKFFKKNKHPSAADFNALEEDLKQFLRTEAIVSAVGSKAESKVQIHPSIASVVNNSTREQMRNFEDDFNTNILPHLYRALIARDRQGVISSLRKWDTNNKNYSKMVRNFLKEYQKTAT